MKKNKKLLILPLDEDSKDIAQILANDTAMKILEVLSENPLSASDVAKKLDLGLTTVHYNIKKLSEVGLIEVVKTRWSKKEREIKIYGPVEKFIVIAPKKIKRKDVIESLRRLLPIILVGGLLFGTFGYSIQPFNVYSIQPLNGNSIQPLNGNSIQPLADNETEVVTEIPPPDEPKSEGGYPIEDDVTLKNCMRYLEENYTEIWEQVDVGGETNHQDPIAGELSNLSTSQALSGLQIFLLWFLLGCGIVTFGFLIWHQKGKISSR